MDDLELLREVFRDDRLHIGIGTVKQTGLALDNSKMRVQVSLLPELREIVCEMTWEDVGMISLPQVGDLVLTAHVDGHPDESFVIRRLTNQDQLIPTFARAGHMVLYPRASQKLYLGSDTKVGIGRTNVEPSEPLVLGNVLATFLTNVLNAFVNSTKIGDAAGTPVTIDTTLKANLTSYINTYLTSSSTNIKSQIAFTERGS